MHCLPILTPMSQRLKFKCVLVNGATVSQSVNVTTGLNKIIKFWQYSAGQRKVTRKGDLSIEWKIQLSNCQVLLRFSTGGWQSLTVATTLMRGHSGDHCAAIIGCTMRVTVHLNMWSTHCISMNALQLDFCPKLLMRSSIAFAPPPHWIITRVHQFKYQICKNAEQPWENQFEGSFPSPFIKVQKVPLAPLVQCHGQFTGQKGGGGRGRNGHRGGAGPKYGRGSADKCALTRPIWGGRGGSTGESKWRRPVVNGQEEWGASKGTMLQPIYLPPKKHQQL